MKRGSKRKTEPVVVIDDVEEDGDTSMDEKEPKASAAKKSGSKGGTDKKKKEVSVSSFTDEEVAQLRTSLLAWYDEHHRVLPWRRTPHSRRSAPAPAGPHESEHPAPDSLDTQQFAYHVWVSEIMLQQTQVATVLPYFARWVARWPTVAALAAADMEELRHAWAGLGYYRRAKYLLDGARHVMDNLGGKFPETAAGLLGIPGVGPYTSAAIGSIAFNDRAAVVDGNVIRVLARLRALPDEPQRLMPTFNALAAQALDPSRPGDFNQAVMELGATICRPKNPDCGACPASSCCKAFAEWQAYCRSRGMSLETPPYPLPAAKGGSKGGGASRGASSTVPRAAKAKAKAGRQGGDAEAEREGLDGGEEEEEEDVGEIEEGGGALPYVTRFPGKKEAKEKRQQAVAVCVLEVLHPRQQAAGTAAAAGSGDGQATERSSSKAAISVPQPKKRQRSMLDYAGSQKAPPPAPTPQQGAAASPSHARSSGTGAGPLADGGQESSGCTGLRAAPLRGMARRYLMVQRAEGSGLLAGLWEFPGSVLEVDGDASYKARKTLTGPMLQGLLGPGFLVPGLTTGGAGAGIATAGLARQQQQQQPQDGGSSEGVQGKAQGQCTAGTGGACARLVNREDAGTYVHVFSHIRQTNYVEVVRIAVDDLTDFMSALGTASQGGLHQPGIASARTKASNGAQVTEQGDVPKLQWLSEDEMLAACKGGRGNKAGGGNGLIGLSTGPRKIFGLVSK